MHMQTTTLQALLLSLDSATRIYDDALATYARSGSFVDEVLARAAHRAMRRVALSVANAVPEN